jgi:DNA invertase Pin-like site-specific DNA recombinase
VDIYARLSRNPDGKVEKIEDQIADCKAVAERMGLVVGEIHADDNFSAWKRRVRRPGWEAMLARIEAGQTGGVVVWHVDRLFRQPRDLETLIELAEKGITLASAHGERDLSNADDRFLLRIEVAHACRSSDDTSRRVRDRVAAMRERGVLTGGPRPFAFPGNAPRVPDTEPIQIEPQVVERERAALRDAADAVLAGTSLSSIARAWNAAGLPTTQGGHWDAPGVRAVLLRQRNAGRVEHRGVVVGTMAEVPIIDPVTQDRVMALMSSRRRGRPVSGRYLATGVAKCGAPTEEGGVCGRTLSGRPKAGLDPDGQPARVYFCAPAHGGCGKTLMDAWTVETEARAFTVARLSDPRHAAQIAQAFAEVANARAELDQQITEAESTVDRLRDRLRRKELSLRAYEMTSVTVVEHLDRLVAEREALDLPTVTGPVETGKAREQVEAAWDSGTQEHRRAMLISALGTTTQLVILPAGRGNRRAGPDPERVSFLPIGQ